MPVNFDFGPINAAIIAHPEQLSVSDDVQEVVESLKSVKKKGYLAQKEFLLICITKSRQRTGDLDDNSSDAIKKVTRFAYSFRSDPFVQIGLLASFRGVRVPRASALLAWVFPDEYPAIDWRAWAVLNRYKLNERKPRGDNLCPRDWVDYLGIVRQLAEIHGQTPMMIDRWLWHEADRLRLKRP